VTLHSYPHTRTVEQVDDYHGTPVADPYRWLEDVEAPETLAWVAEQNTLTERFLARVPARERLRRRLAALWNYPRQMAPLRRGGRYFQLRNTGLQNQDVLYVLDNPRGEARLLLDPNTLSPDGTVALSHWAPSQDGRWLAYATTASGSDWLTWRVRDVDNGADLPDLIEWSKFSEAAWLPDSSGFFYSAYDPPAAGQAYTGANLYKKVYLHRLGEAQASDTLVYYRPDHKHWGYGVTVTDDGRYLVLHVTEGSASRNRLFYQDLQTSGPVIELIPELDASYRFVGNDGGRFYLLTNSEAPRGRLVAIDVDSPERQNWQTLLPEGDDTLEEVRLVNNLFVAQYLHQAHHVLRLFSLDGQPAGGIDLPMLGSVSVAYISSLSGQRHHHELFYVFHSFIHPITVYSYDFAAGRSQVLFAPPIDFDFSRYEMRQEFVTSRDGTRVPLFVVDRSGRAPRAGRRLDGQGASPRPTLLFGYGGFNIPQTPVFQVGRLAWLEMGGALVVATLRGGGEFGEAWHQAGTQLQKQNTFDDFIACAEHLIASGFTSSECLAIEGRSNGGLLVGACITQRPELFGAALAHVGVMDMLRFHKFTVGWAWVNDYGSADDPEQFKVLHGYSPLHNIRPGTTYPATLVTTADRDDRVVPGHSFKFTAALQAAQAGDAPVLIRVQTRAGHGHGKPTAIQIAELADVWAFLVQALGMEGAAA
jgi:prolyl oligopeptidase